MNKPGPKVDVIGQAWPNSTRLHRKTRLDKSTERCGFLRACILQQHVVRSARAPKRTYVCDRNLADQRCNSCHYFQLIVSLRRQQRAFRKLPFHDEEHQGGKRSVRHPSKASQDDALGHDSCMTHFVVSTAARRAQCCADLSRVHHTEASPVFSRKRSNTSCTTNSPILWYVC